MTARAVRLIRGPRFQISGINNPLIQIADRMRARAAKYVCPRMFQTGNWATEGTHYLRVANGSEVEHTNKKVPKPPGGLGTVVMKRWGYAVGLQVGIEALTSSFSSEFNTTESVRAACFFIPKFRNRVHSSDFTGF